MTTRRLLPILALFALALVLVTPTTAFAQADLAEENKQLKEEIAELEERLERANQQIKALSDEVKRLRTMRTGGAKDDTGGGEGGDEPALIADPYASASDYIETLRNEYNEEFDELDPDDRRARGARIRDIRSWASDVRRERQGAITWEVVLDSSDGPAIGRIEATFRSLGSLTGQPEGEPFTVRLRADDLRTLRDADESTTWVLTGEVSPRIGVETDRMTPDDPGRGIFIGPMAELFLDIRVDSIRAK